MTRYFDFKGDAAVFVSDWLLRSKLGSQLTMTIIPGKSEGCYVISAIEGSSEDTDLQTAKFFSQTQVNT